MKSVACGLFWWPRLDHDIEMAVKQCRICQQVQPLPPSAPLWPWSWPIQPWSRLHVDFAGPVEGKILLVVVDAHSKWIEVLPMGTATSWTTIQQLRQLFARFGLPSSIVSDNGPQFVSTEFAVVPMPFIMSLLPRTILPQMVWQNVQLGSSRTA